MLKPVIKAGKLVKTHVSSRSHKGGNDQTYTMNIFMYFFACPKKYKKKTSLSNASTRSEKNKKI